MEQQGREILCAACKFASGKKCKHNLHKALKQGELLYGCSFGYEELKHIKDISLADQRKRMDIKKLK